VLFRSSQADPSAPCATGDLKLAGDRLEIDLSVNQITLKADARLGVIDFVCFDCAWQSHAFSHSADWHERDQLIIALGSDTLIISNKIRPVTAVAKSGFSSPAGATCAIQSQSLIFRTPVSGAKAVHTVAVYDARGRRLMQFQPRGATTILPIPSLAQGLLCVSFQYADGTSARRVAPIVR
jgi:hypothetical protein